MVLALTRIGHVALRFDGVLATMWLDMSVLKESRGRKRERERDRGREKFIRDSRSEQQRISHDLHSGVTASSRLCRCCAQHGSC